MNIIEIYKKYHLPEHLQMHMLRVAACSNLIIDNWNGKKLDKESIIRVCLLHDMQCCQLKKKCMKSSANLI